jgi:hypothetical protein
LYQAKASVRQAADFVAPFAQALDRRWDSARSLPSSPAELGVPIPEQAVADVRIESRERFTVTVRMSRESQGLLVFRTTQKKREIRVEMHGPRTRRQIFAAQLPRRKQDSGRSRSGRPSAALKFALAPSFPRCLWSNRLDSNWSSMQVLRRHSALLSRRRSCWAPAG